MSSTPIKFNLRDFGARGDGENMDTAALHKVIHACVEAGGGTVVVPAGTYRVGPFELFSHVTLFLESGAVILASDRLEDYPLEDSSVSMESQRAGLVTAHHAEDVAIVGRGTIDGNGFAFVDHERIKMFEPGADYDPSYTRQGTAYMQPSSAIRHGPMDHGERPGNLLRFDGCYNVLLEGVTICNSPTWTVHIYQCEVVTIRGARIHSQGSDWRVPNDDGIDLRESKKIHISDCDINTGDDCIAVFGSQKITVTNCTLSSRSSGIRVAYDQGQTCDCTFNNLVIHSNRGLGVFVRGDGSVENILFSDIVIRTDLITGHWWGKGEPIHVSALAGVGSFQALGQIRDVRFINILAESENGIVLYGSPESILRGILLENVSIRLKSSPLQAAYGGNFDLRAARDVSHALFAHDIPGLYACYCDGLTVHNFRLDGEAVLPEYFRKGLRCEHFTDLEIQGYHANPTLPVERTAIVLQDGHGMNVEAGKALVEMINAKL
ncbi:MAG: glycosyl hydrolase family 28 protein [Anaerolineales bacterium]|jgi:polygalacturonase